MEPPDWVNRSDAVRVVEALKEAAGAAWIEPLRTKDEDELVLEWAYAGRRLTLFVAGRHVDYYRSDRVSPTHGVVAGYGLPGCLDDQWRWLTTGAG